jgi:hypothetical protein
MEKMFEKKFYHAFVCDAGGYVIGVVSLKDISRVMVNVGVYSAMKFQNMNENSFAFEKYILTMHDRNY